MRQPFPRDARWISIKPVLFRQLCIITKLPPFISLDFSQPTLNGRNQAFSGVIKKSYPHYLNKYLSLKYDVEIGFIRFKGRYLIYSTVFMFRKYTSNFLRTSQQFYLSYIFLYFGSIFEIFRKHLHNIIFSKQITTLVKDTLPPRDI